MIPFEPESEMLADIRDIAVKNRVPMTVVLRTAAARLVEAVRRHGFKLVLPAATMIAIGVARPRAHGQAMMRTLTAAIKP